MTEAAQCQSAGVANPAVPLAVGRCGRRRILLIGMADFTTVRPIGSRRSIRTGGIVPSSHGMIQAVALPCRSTTLSRFHRQPCRQDDAANVAAGIPP